MLADTKHRRRARLKDGPWDALALQTLEADLTTATLALLECGGLGTAANSRKATGNFRQDAKNPSLSWQRKVSS